MDTERRSELGAEDPFANLLVFLQCPYRGLSQFDAPPALHGLGSLYLSIEHRPLHLEDPGLQIEILPLKAQKFARTHSRGDGQHIQGFELISFRSLKEPLYLLLIERLYLPLRSLRRVNRIGHVSRDQGPPDRLLESFIQGGMD